MELTGYWGFDDPDLHARLAGRCAGNQFASGPAWALGTPTSAPGATGADDAESVLPVRDTDGTVCGLVVGRLHAPRGVPAFLDAAALDPASCAADLTDRVWGSYAAAAVVGQGRDSRAWFGGDPIGLRAMFWARHRGGVVFASRTADLVHLLGRRPDLDWDHLNGYLGHGELPAATTGFAGVHMVRPGTRTACDADGAREHCVWNPFAFATEQAAATPSPGEVRTVVQDSVDAWAGDAESVYVELSGGLDSAVVAQALVRSGRRVVGGHFHHGSSALADELAYARAVAEHLGVELVLIDADDALPLAPVPDAGRHWDFPGGHQPWESLLTAHRRIAAERGCTTAMSGDGGDHVFLSRPGLPVHLHDHLRRRGLRAAAAELSATSRATGSPLAHLTLDVLRWEAARCRGGTAMLDCLAGAQETPAWMAGRERPQHGHPAQPLPATAGKAVQALAVTLLGTRIGNRHGTARPDATLRPLLSQPVVELGLRTPVPALLDSDRDRILLRDAMRGLLPDVLLDRTSKGETTATWQRGMRTHLARARDLVDRSAAASAGIIAPAPAHAALSAAALGHTGRLWPLVQLLATELWIRSWRTDPGRPEAEASAPVAERAHSR